MLNPQFKRVAFSTTALVLCLGLSFVALPFALVCIMNALYTAAMIHFMGMAYATLNDILAVRACPEYFIKGHTSFHRRLIQTEDKLSNAVIWGIAASSGLAFPAGVIFGIVALIATLAGAPFLGPMLLCFGAGLLATLLIASIAAVISTSRLKKSNVKLQRYLDSIFFEGKIFADGFQYEDVLLEDIPSESRAAYCGNNTRNLIGYVSAGVLAVGGLTTMIILSAQHIALTALTLSLPLQMCFAGLPAAIVLSGLLYCYGYKKYQDYKQRKVGANAGCIEARGDNANNDITTSYKIAFDSDPDFRPGALPDDKSDGESSKDLITSQEPVQIGAGDSVSKSLSQGYQSNSSFDLRGATLLIIYRHRQCYLRQGKAAKP